MYMYTTTIAAPPSSLSHSFSGPVVCVQLAGSDAVEPRQLHNASWQQLKMQVATLLRVASPTLRHAAKPSAGAVITYEVQYEIFHSVDGLELMTGWLLCPKTGQRR